MPEIEIVPPTLTAAAGPLHEAATLLRALADDRSGVEHLGDGSPDPALREALRAFVKAWELALWDLASHAGSLADELRRCAQDYVQVDDALAREAHLITRDAGWRDIR